MKTLVLLHVFTLKPVAALPIDAGFPNIFVEQPAQLTAIDDPIDCWAEAYCSARKTREIHCLAPEVGKS
ncbi:MAG: hypothetical protein ACK2UK_06015 [Candidatus Promineifilaceae bacterium]|jgi:hypothetical protein